ncbi:hypothetical protein SI859A1_00334 [Aurantimonas manganoxydans SI85-9A1]|uniref:Uncharacterized protein n=1 Tax=Aurantimonas manganoxydans (strain ATCC BAA-1229 / DSM 21871 / SI85-9A1) TaxID=287752 RepID=Q1YHA3_AURMS|nr:hypothetical protein SI859A1_00334 [Aurantimonas manganoxydans SI85-9A1]
MAPGAGETELFIRGKPWNLGARMGSMAPLGRLGQADDIAPVPGQGVATRSRIHRVGRVGDRRHAVRAQQMIERATDGDRRFDVIVRYSCFFRDCFGLEMYIRRLAKVGVRGGRAKSTAVGYGRIIASQREATNTQDELKRLYRLAKDGVADMDDILREQITSLRLDGERVRHARPGPNAAGAEPSDPTETCRALSVVADLYGNGAPERIRTSDPQIRSLVLYPAELRAHPEGAASAARS